MISALPHRDITMQGVEGLGDFSFYQGVWRMQPLPGCAQPGFSAMRLTYSVELSPRLWVPVALLEGNIAKALGENLEAIRDFVSAKAEAAAAERAAKEAEDAASIEVVGAGTVGLAERSWPFELPAWGQPRSRNRS